MPQSAVYRRRQVDAAKAKGERLVKAELVPVLAARYKSLSRELRQGNLKKRLHKDEFAFEKAAKFNWTPWFDLFEKTLKKGIVTGANYVWDAEARFFNSFNYPTFPFNAQEVFDAYQARVGTQITNIARNTEVYVNQAITDWYKTDKGLPDLIGMLEQFFSPYRAELIATTEMAYVASEVAYTMMDNYGIELWQWDAFQDAVTCDLCLDLMAQSKQKPFTANDPMPPDPSHPKCILPGQVVAVPNLSGGAKSFYEGVVVEITTESGNRLTVTPNHPILTQRGWVNADLLDDKGMYVVSHIDPQRMMQSVNPNNKQRPALVEDVFTSLKMTPGMISVPVKPAPEDFYGDAKGIEGEVDIVYPQRHLWNRIHANTIQQFHHVGFGRVQSSSILNTYGMSNFLVNRFDAPFCGLVSSLDLQSALGFAHPTPFHSFSLALSTHNDAIFDKIVANDASVNTVFMRQLFLRNAGLIKLDKVRNIRKYDFSGHVYDLSSDGFELYTCNNIITHNCRCGVYFVGVDVNVKKWTGVDFAKGGPGSGNFGHSGRIGERGGSGGGSLGGGNPVIGVTSYSGVDIEKIEDASNLIDTGYGAIVVAKKGSEVLATRTEEFHSDIVESTHPGKTVDDYVRFRVKDGSLVSDNGSAGIVVDDEESNIKAIDEIYSAIDKLQNLGLPDDTKTIIYQGSYGEPIVFGKLALLKAHIAFLLKNDVKKWAGVDFAKGGPGSGNFGHSGRIGERGGSGGGALGGGGASTEALIDDWTNDATKWRELDEQGKANELIEAVAKQPVFNGLAYRGMIVDQKTAETILNTKELEVKGISSFSTQKSTAFNYADPSITGEEGVGIVIRTRLQGARVIQTETINEVAVRRTSFQIVSTLKEAAGNWLVVADQMPGGNMWSIDNNP